MSKRYTTDIFITKSIQKHGNRYNYDKVLYKTNRDKVTIGCLKHGDFKQVPDKHWRGQGCPKCGINKRNKANTNTKKDFIVKAYFPYDYEIVTVFTGEAREISELERKLHREHKDFKYVPEIYFHGISECFTQIKEEYGAVYN